MTTKPTIDLSLRDKILSHPDVILDDRDVMSALIAANDKSMGGNIVDLRGIAMDRLETRLDRLEDTHRSVIAAAYDNLSGTQQVQRAVLRLMEADGLETFLNDLNGDVAEILRVEAVALVLEFEDRQTLADLAGRENALVIRPQGFIEDYLTRGRGASVRDAILRERAFEDSDIFGPVSADIASEACFTLTLGRLKRRGLLVLGSCDKQVFCPQQGTDLLRFFADVCENLLRRWVA